MTQLLMVISAQDHHIIFKFELVESNEFSGALILVMWSNLLLLLAKCQKPGCGAAVLPDNMKVIRNGIKTRFLYN